MEVPYLASSEYWEADEIDLRLNPKKPLDSDGLQTFLSKEIGMERAVVMATSGSSGIPKFVVLSKEALLASARSVISHLKLNEGDSWFAGLSDFHVGGLGIYARAYASGAHVIPRETDRWDRSGAPFVESLRKSGARWTSLTPSHLHDLVEATRRAPGSLAGVVLGGGVIDCNLMARALDLGWPVRGSFGMTEACSQIATGAVGESEWLDILPGWEVRTDGEGRLSIRGAALFSGYAVKEDQRWQFLPATDADGWFETGDRVELSGDRLRHLGRCDDVVKVLGELVSVSALESRLVGLLSTHSRQGAVVSTPHPRRGAALVAFIEGEPDSPLEAKIDDAFTGLDQLASIHWIEALPRTDLGKVDRNALRQSPMVIAAGSKSTSG